jgi:TIGR03009 family protein
MVSMHLRACHPLAVLAIFAAAVFASSARGQTGAGSASKSPPRTAQRNPARPEVQPASNTAPENVGRRAPAEPPARSSTSRGGANTQPQASGRSPEPAAKAVAPKAPFVLSESQQKLLDQILIKWEKQSDKVKTYKCSFTRWEYDLAFGNPKDDWKKSEGQGQIKYKAPDCGEYIVSSLVEFDPTTGNTKPKTEGLDHWLCDGKAIFEFNAEKKQLIERRLPPQLQGQAIADGPLPFIFGAKADQLKRRYWMRDVTPKDEVGKSVWLEAIPKYQQDAANFQSATVILNDSDFMPKALRIYMPGGKTNSDYGFASSKLNDPLAPVLEFLTPRLSPSMRLSGWKYVLEEDPSEAQKKAQPPAGEPAQAKRPSVGRK